MSSPKYAFVHLRMNEAVTAECDELVAHLQRDPEWRRACETPDRPDALRFALGIAVEFVRRPQALKLSAETKALLLRALQDDIGQQAEG